MSRKLFVQLFAVGLIGLAAGIVIGVFAMRSGRDDALARLDRADAEELRARLGELEDVRDENTELVNRLRRLKAERDKGAMELDEARALIAELQRPPATEDSPDIDQLTAEIEAALAGNEGKLVLALLSEMAALGEEFHDEVVNFWAALLETDDVGLGRLDLQAALLAQPAILRLALRDTEQPTAFRHLAADTLKNAPRRDQVAVLKELDLALEPDRKVVNTLAPTMMDARDTEFLPQLGGLVARDDLSNNFRQLMASAVAELDGEEADAVFRETVEESVHPAIQRVAPALRVLRDPPTSSGLVVINGPTRPTARNVCLGDVIVEYNGDAVASHEDLWTHAAATTKDETVAVKIWRDGREQTVRIPGGTGAYDFRVALASREIRGGH